MSPLPDDHLPVPAPRATSAADSPNFIICGDTPLAFRIADELASRYRADVTVLLSDVDAGQGPRMAQLRRVRLRAVRELTADAFRELGLTPADAIAFVLRDDIANLYGGLQAQEVAPGVRVVMRITNSALGQRVAQLFDNAQVLSDADIAAPAFVSAALGIAPTTEVRFGSVSAHVVTRAELREDDEVLCALAATAPELPAPVILPDDPDIADLLLVKDRRRPRAGRAPRRRLPDRIGALSRRFQSGRVSRGVSTALFVLASVLVLGTAAYAILDRQHSVWRTMYFMFLTAVGEANPDDTLAEPLKILQSIVTFTGVASIPVVSAAVVQAAVPALSRVSVTVRGHVVVVGIGKTGARVLQDLHERGYDVVAVDQEHHPYGAQYIREHRIHFIVGDASRGATLRRANVAHAAALIVLTADDLVNLEYAVQGRDLRSTLRVVLRLFDGDFADRVKRTFNIQTSRSVSFLSAGAFAAAMVGREVTGTIPIRRRVLLVAEVPVTAGSALVGRRIQDACPGGDARVVAVIEHDTGRTVTDLDPDRELREGDRVALVATRLGLSTVIGSDHSAARS